MTKKERFAKVLDYFQKNRPVAETELQYKSPYELIVAVILSAQCTDKRVNMITPALLERFPDIRSMAAASPEEVYPYIRSCTYPNNKSKHLVNMAATVLDRFGGEIPPEVNRLQQLPGVGRKTANVIASVIFNQPTIAVDTHVFRVSARIGLTTHSKTPLETERQLEKYIPLHIRSIAHHWLILHGRYICTARSPKCYECGLVDFCRYTKKNLIG